MTRQTTFLLPKNLTGPMEYIPYRYCLAYIKQKSAVIPYSGKGQADRLRIMERVGMKNYHKFYRRRIEWDMLKGHIPLLYLDAIGVDMKVLSYCLELDSEAYLKALQVKREFTHADARKAPLFYGFVSTPEDCTNEGDAIDFFHQLMLDPQAPYTHLNLSILAIVYHTFERGHGHTGTYYCDPNLTISKGYVSASTFK